MDDFRYIRVERPAGAVVVHFTETDLRGDTIAECIRLEVDRILQFETPPRLLVDFSGVRSISSAVISTLLVIREKAHQRGISFGLSSVPVPIREIYRTLQLEGTKFQVYDSVEVALRASRHHPARHTPRADRRLNATRRESRVSERQCFAFPCSSVEFPRLCLTRRSPFGARAFLRLFFRLGISPRGTLRYPQLETPGRTAERPDVPFSLK